MCDPDFGKLWAVRLKAVVGCSLFVLIRDNDNKRGQACVFWESTPAFETLAGV